jgi:hypothetical protein
MTPPIYALYVTSERRAHRDLVEMGFDVWRPTYQRLNRARTALEPAPLLATYVLARIPAERFHDALSPQHVAYAIQRQIPEDVIAQLRADVEAGRYDDAAPAPPQRPAVKPKKMKHRTWKKNRARGARRRGLQALEVWFSESQALPIADAA